MSHPILTDKAAQKVGALMAEEQNFSLMLRTFIQGGGCSGFEYGFTFETEANEEDQKNLVQVPKFPQTPTTDLFSKQCLNISEILNLPEHFYFLVDPISFPYLKGATVDFVINTQGQQFLVDNPQAKTTCGCGASFST